MASSKRRSSPEDAEPQPQSVLGRIHLGLTIASLAASLVLGVATYASDIRAKDFQKQKEGLEQEILLEQNSPRLDLYRVIVPRRALLNLSKEESPPSFLPNIERYRVVGSDVSAEFSGNGRMKAGQYLLVLVIANTGKSTAYDVSIGAGNDASMGIIESGTALLFPERVISSTEEIVDAARIVGEVKYKYSIAGMETQGKISIPRPTAVSWSPYFPKSTVNLGLGVSHAPGVRRIAVDKAAASAETQVGRASADRDHDAKLEDILPR